MKQNVPGAVAVVIVIVVVLLLAVFGWRKVSGADNDVTQETVSRYQNMSKQTFGAGGSSQMTHGKPPADAPAASAGNP